MGARGIVEARWGYHQFVLTSGKQAYRGNMACLDLAASGQVVPGQASTTLLPIGWFTEDLLGDGTKLVQVKLFAEFASAWWDNTSAPHTLVASDIGNSCYVLDATTVTDDATGHSLAGRVLAVSATKGVLVQAGFAVTGPSGPSGASLLGGGVADRTALAAITAANRYTGMVVLVRSDNSLWVFAGTGTAVDTTQNLVVAPAAGSGVWLRQDQTMTLKIPITFATEDAAAIFTVPTGFVLKPVAAPYWDVSVAFTGGTNASIGLSSGTRSGYTTKGDLVGATLLAALTAGIRKGTIGGQLGTVTLYQTLFLEATDTLRHDRIVDAFTAGAANVCLPVALVTAPAAA